MSRFARRATRALLAAALFLGFGGAARAQKTDLVVAQSASTLSPNVGDTVLFTITLSNAGPAANATGVQVTDALPAGLSFGTATPSQGTYDPATGLWAVGTVGKGGPPKTLQITAMVVNPSAQTNTAAVSHLDQTDPIAKNDAASVTVNPLQADLVLAKTVSNPTPNVGDTITYTITLFDDGPDAATNVTVHDALPAGVAFASATPSEGTYVSATGVWTVGTVTPGTPQTLGIQVTVTSPAPAANAASVTHADQFDPDPSNNSDTASVTPTQADLVVTKSVSSARPNVGDVVIFTVTVIDDGPSAATGVQVSDPLPAGLSFVSATPSQGVYSAAPGVWTVGTVNEGTPQTLVVRASVAGPNAVANTATITASDQFDPMPGNDFATATVTPQRADLALGKDVDNPVPNVGDVVAFQVVLTNAGPDAATNVTVQETLPAGLVLVSATPSQGTFAPPTGLWSVGTVAPGTPRTLVVNASVVSAVPQTNTTSISHGDQFDPNTADNSASATVTPQQADLALVETVSNATPNVGDAITFTVTLVDAGPDPATNVTVQDLLPPGLSLVSAVPSQGTYAPATGTWTVGTVSPGPPRTLALQATVASTAAQTNAAAISHSDQFDPNPGNNVASATETPQQADLALAKVVDDPTPNVGDAVQFTIALSNGGPNAATNVTVLDLLPPGLTFVSATPSQGSYDAASGLWTVGTVAPGAPPALVLRATVTSPAPEANTASVAHADQFDPNPANNSATASLTPARADLSLIKVVDVPTPNVGDTVTFTITLVDAGPSPATNVRVTDLLPAGLVFVSATPSQGAYDPATGLWTVGTVTTGAPRTLQIRALVASPAPVTNTAAISHADQSDPVVTNNSASATVAAQQADLVLAKMVSNPTPNVGDSITYTILVFDAGPGAATNVTVQDTLPAQVAFVSATPSQGTYDSVTGIWTVGTVTTGAPRTLNITATVTGPSPGANTAAVSHADQFDPNFANNSATASVDPAQADVVLIKSVDAPTPNVGDAVAFSITVVDAGPSTATGVTVHDLLPAGLVFVSATPSQGVYASATGTWTVGTLDKGLPQSLVLRATVASAAAQTNAATISHSDQPDPGPGNDSASATVTPRQADLALGKSVDDPLPNVGDVVTFQVTLSDAGPDAATNVTVQDLLPAGLAFVSANPSQGTYDSTTGVWIVGTVVPSVAPTLVVKATIVSAAAQTNAAAVSSSDQFDPNAANNAASATVTPLAADLALSKTVDAATPVVGQQIVFTIDLFNAGPDAATNVMVHDLLPAGITFVSALPPQGTYDPATGLWNVGTMPFSHGVALQLRGTVVSTLPQTNTASISHSDQFDPNPANNSASATETPVVRADLGLAKTVDEPAPILGQTVTFTVTLTNDGPDTATGVTVQDLLPAGLTLVSAAPSQGSYDSATGAWTVGTVTTGSPQTLIVKATVASRAPQTNTAAISHADQTDPNPANDSASALVAPGMEFFTVAPCRVFDTRVGAPIAAGGTLTVTLTGGPCGLPATAAVAAVNLTVTRSTAGGSIVVHAADQPTPPVDTLSFGAGQTRANNALVLLATDGSGQVKVFNDSTGTVHVVLDVSGYYR